jgi:hypothetical protein
MGRYSESGTKKRPHQYFDVAFFIFPLILENELDSPFTTSSPEYVITGVSELV